MRRRFGPLLDHLGGAQISPTLLFLQIDYIEAACCVRGFTQPSVGGDILLEMKWHTNPDGTLAAKWCDAGEKDPTVSMALEYQRVAHRKPSPSAKRPVLEDVAVLVEQG